MTELQIQALCLTQALLGAISPNFRMVSISSEVPGYKIRVVLAKESEEDREEIADVETEFESQQSNRIEYEFDIVVSDRPLDRPGASSVVVYLRREE